MNTTERGRHSTTVAKKRTNILMKNRKPTASTKTTYLHQNRILGTIFQKKRRRSR